MNIKTTQSTLITTLTVLGLGLSGLIVHDATAATAKNATAATAKNATAATAKNATAATAKNATAATARKSATAKPAKKVASSPAEPNPAANPATKPATIPTPSDTGVTGEQLAAKKAAAALTSTQRSKMLELINEGSSTELVAIQGIGRTRATAVAEARPFASLDQLVEVKGVGDAVFTGLIAHAKSLTVPRSVSSPAAEKNPPVATIPRKGC